MKGSPREGMVGFRIEDFCICSVSVNGDDESAEVPTYCHLGV